MRAAIEQVFEQVAHLRVPVGGARRATPPSPTSASALASTAPATTGPCRNPPRPTQVIERLGALETQLAQAERAIDAAHGGDADAARRARARSEIDAALAEADRARRGGAPRLTEETRWAPGGGGLARTSAPIAAAPTRARRC
ncbi:MAG: hypothetical protein HS111_23355 [Kofleriaceae bacterium]|nr:hypothetical protein [Kofleriaceae bacterium]